MKLRYLLLLLGLSLQFFVLKGQGLVFNDGGIARISGGAFMVIDNPSSNAIKRINTGHIITESSADKGSNRVRWMIGNANGTYTIPFGVGTNEYIPLTLTTAAANGGNGYIDFSTYATDTWKNSDFLPPGVLNVNDANNIDNSAKVIDRFWRIEAQGYAVKPALSDVFFSYRDIEHSEPNNMIIEISLKAQRWNSDILGWGDYLPQGSADVNNNFVHLPSVTSNDLYTWWTLVDKDFPLPVKLLSFKAYLENKNKVGTAWKTSQEVNVSHYEVERSIDGINYVKIGEVKAVGNSQVEQSYYYPDNNLPNGINVLYYRLKMVDMDNSYEYSPVEIVKLNGANGDWKLYPNPVSVQGYVQLQVPSGITLKGIQFFDESGRMMSNQRYNNTTNSTILIPLPVNRLSGGNYVVKVIYNNNQTKLFKLIKQN